MSLSIVNFAKKQGYASYCKTVRTNTNGYPFITFLFADKDSEGNTRAENVYFSKRAGELVDEGSIVDKSLTSQLQARLVEYTDGRTPQWKLCSIDGDSAYASIDDL